jgi:hypothetical protein
MRIGYLVLFLCIAGHLSAQYRSNPHSPYLEGDFSFGYGVDEIAVGAELKAGYQFDRWVGVGLEWATATTGDAIGSSSMGFEAVAVQYRLLPIDWLTATGSFGLVTDGSYSTDCYCDNFQYLPGRYSYASAQLTWRFERYYTVGLRAFFVSTVDFSYDDLYEEPVITTRMHSQHTNGYQLTIGFSIW